MKLPAELIKKLHDVHEDATPWLVRLDHLIADLETRWRIRVTGLVEELSYNVVAFAEGESGTRYVLKLSPPSDDVERESAALHLYDGDGLCRLVAAEPEAAALLLERLEPGVSLGNREDDELATRICADLLAQLWRPVPEPNPFRTLRSWARALPNYLAAYPQGDGPLPHRLVKRACSLLEDLLQANEPPVLLHADLHHTNILSATRQPYLAIDPKGIVGPRGYDVVPFLMNPLDITTRPDLKKRSERRIEVFSDRLALDRTQIISWGVVHMMLSSCWSLEHHGRVPNGPLMIAEVLEGLR